MENIKNLPVDRIYPNRHNPRKNIGDISELKLSISKNGIMQNLTVKKMYKDVPDDKQRYTILIGHRRFEAAKKLGMTEVPCKILEDISKADEIAIMLAENMQRNDLTLSEQAESFQMMIDFGETAESIAKKTGFHTSTVYHRLNLAKLDQEVLKEKTEGEDHQLSITTLQKLEKVDSIEARNRILKNSTSSKNMEYEIDSELKYQDRKENLETLKNMIKEYKIPSWSGDKKFGRWDKTFEVIAEINAEFIDEDKIRKKIEKAVNKYPQKLYYTAEEERYFATLYIFKYAEVEEKDDAEEELKKQKAERREQRTKTARNFRKKRMEFIGEISKSKKTCEDETEMLEELFEYKDVFESSCKSFLAETMFDKSSTYSLTNEEEAEVEETYKSWPLNTKILVGILYENPQPAKPLNWSDVYEEGFAKQTKEEVSILKKHFGYNITDEEEDFYNGTHAVFEE